MELMESLYSTYSCATLRYLTDADRGVTVPVGVILWENNGAWYRIRLPEPEEHVVGIPPVKAQPYLELVKSQIEGWIKQGDLPYDQEALKPLSHAWWQHVEKLLRFTVRIDGIRIIDCQDPEDEIETLFEAIVQPRVSRRDKLERIDTAVSRALGSVSSFFHRGKVPGFGGRGVKVLRCAESRQRLVVVEAVNLASRDAETDADALYGRLSRIREGQQGREVHFVLGYLASAHGLNGETALKEFIEAKVETRMYDLDRQKSEFEEAAYVERSVLEDNISLFPRALINAINATRE